MATMTERATLIGVFERRDQAHQAVQELHRAGFRDADITMVMHHDLHRDVEVTDLDAAKAPDAASAPAASPISIGCRLRARRRSLPRVGIRSFAGPERESNCMAAMVMPAALRGSGLSRRRR